MENRTESAEARELRVLLAAVLEAIGIPYPATVGDGEAYGRILEERVMDARIALEGVLRRGDDPGWSAEYLRIRLAGNPAVGYRAAGGAEQLPDDVRAIAEESIRELMTADDPLAAAREFVRVFEGEIAGGEGR
ncbi:hypothetical protein PYK79_23135 [Streptomyces sp. ID05-04B]|uniref:hypothetical protein n=1 Tax=Streptomyces sp. ID05-04B TaxID=3028661 RepID=UPI0029C2DE4B|nr:hypothetical protein [Streptomyces sp. ID05-04B]MDX5565637.1 hypothetical protein [Streptomyces sp. ID05-04B]